jgi:hypothetical protein
MSAGNESTDPDQGDRKSGKTHSERADNRLDHGHIIQYDLDELVAGITDENRHDLIDFGEPVGREAW